MKICNKCNEILKLEDFSRDSHSKDGRHTICLFCKSKKFREYAKNNPDIIRSKGAKRRACEKNATPKWLSDLHKKQIREIYKRSVYLEKTTNLSFDVDHIIPLSHPNICGLHVPWNLQVMEKTNNIKKSNKIDNTRGNF